MLYDFVATIRPRKPSDVNKTMMVRGQCDAYDTVSAAVDAIKELNQTLYVSACDVVKLEVNESP